MQADDQPDNGSALSCGHDTLNAVTQAVDATPVPTTTIFTITDNVITEMDLVYGSPDFLHAGEPFSRWLDAHHPNTPEAQVFTWTSVDEAAAFGAALAEYAALWADYLDANGCTYLDAC